MTELETLSPKSKYYLTKAQFRTVYYYAKQYPEWLNEYNALNHSVKSPAPGNDSGGSNGTVSDTTALLGARRAALRSRMEIIEDLCEEVAPEISNYLLLGVTGDGVGYQELDNMNIPCGRNTYYSKRRIFYHRLYQTLYNAG
jgi:hypothetical protein